MWVSFKSGEIFLPYFGLISSTYVVARNIKVPSYFSSIYSKVRSKHFKKKYQEVAICSVSVHDWMSLNTNT